VTDTALADTAQRYRDTGFDEAGLQPRAFRFLAALPPDLRPLKSGEKYPGIVNQLALLNRKRGAFDIYLDKLLIDARGNRQGFSQDVADELYRLRIFCEAAVHPRPGRLRRRRPRIALHSASQDV